MYAPNNSESKYVRQNWQNRQLHHYSRWLHTPPSVTERTSRQEVSKGTKDPNSVTHQLVLVHIYSTLHLTAAEYTFFSKTRGPSTAIDHISGRGNNFNKFSKREIMRSIFSDHKRIKLEMSSRKVAGRSPKFWKLSNILLDNSSVNEEVLREI